MTQQDCPIDSRALCAELLQELEHPSSWDYQQVLKDQALAVLDDISDRLDAAHENVIRRALEQLPDAK
jgi:hypothetical protein